LAASIVAVCGLKREAALIARNHEHIVIGGGDAAVLRQRLEGGSNVSAVISIGICGALSAALKVGDCVIASEVVLPNGERVAVDSAWQAELRVRIPEASTGAIAGTDEIVLESGARRALEMRTRAIAVDMESHIAAAFARARAIPFAALRVISDAAETALPPAVLGAMAPDGGVRVGAVLRSLLAQPSQLPALIRTARETDTAFRVLLRCLDRLGGNLAAPDFG